MPDRKQFLGSEKADKDLLELLEASKAKQVTEAELHEQRISFAFGNAPAGSKITKDSVRAASQNISLRHR